MANEFASSTFEHYDNSSITAVLEDPRILSYARCGKTKAEIHRKTAFEILCTFAHKVCTFACKVFGSI